MNPPPPARPHAPSEPDVILGDVTGLPARIGEMGVAAGAPAPRHKVLFFRAAGEWFALGLQHVREVCPRSLITRVPRAPGPVVGVMNLRGRVVTVVDLARCLDLPASGETASQVVLLDLGDPELSVGLLAERIDQVVEVEPAFAGPPPRAETAGGREGPELLDVGGRVATVLDPARVLGSLLGGVGEGMGAGQGPEEGGRGRA